MGSENIVIEVPTRHINFSPLGFYKYAKDYLIASNAIHQGESFSPVPYFLHCRSIELALKAFLATKGLSLKDAKPKYGHDLNKLLSSAKREGISSIVSINTTEEGAIKKANSYYKKKSFEYFDLIRAAFGFKDLPDLNILSEFNKKLISSIEEECKSFVRNN